MNKDQGWLTWKEKHVKTNLFGRNEKIAYKNFKTNEQKVLMHNENPNRTYDQEINKFSIYDEEEFSRLYNGFRMPAGFKSGKALTVSDFEGPLGKFNNSNYPKSVDFRNLCPPIQDQGGCGSCWAFATASGIEIALKARDPTFSRIISQSYFVDCDKKDYGCQGGWPYYAALFSRDTSKNLAPDKIEYPYKYPSFPFRRNICKKITKMNLIKLNIKNLIHPPKLTLDEMQVLLANHGHIVVGLYATRNFQNYKTGIFSETDSCYTGKNKANHAVVVVGYDKDKKYFIIRNSWGTSWGEQGYMRMAFGDHGLCNIEIDPLVIS